MAESVVSNFNTLYLLSGFNNYFNRTVKKLSAISDYVAASGSYEAIANINFNPADGVSTTQVINPASVHNPDYLLVCTENTIESRWFVLECHRNRKGQYTLLLKRDVIADNLDALNNADFFCEKGYAGTDNPLLFNSESMGYNQIKQSETLLMDPTETPWIVGYISKPTSELGDISVEGTVSTANTDYNLIDVDELPEGFPQTWGTAGFATAYGHPNSMTIHIAAIQQRAANIGTASVPDNINVNVDYDISLTVNYNAQGDPAVANAPAVEMNAMRRTVNYTDWTQSTLAYPSVFETGNPAGTYNPASLMGLRPLPLPTTPFIAQLGTILKNHSSDFEISRSPGGGLIPTPGIYFDPKNTLEEIKALEGRILRVETATPGSYDYYQIIILTYFERTRRVSFTGTETETTAVSMAMKSYLQGINKWNAGADTQSMYAIEYTVPTYLVAYTPLTSGKVTATLQELRNHLNDSPYDMFFMPFYSKTVDEGGRSWSTNPLLSLALAYGMQPASSGGYLYDLQLLPYCPDKNIREMIGSTGAIQTGTLSSSDYSLIYDNSSEKVGILLWGTTPKGTFDIESPIAPLTNSAMDLKISNECDMYRIVSPNFNGAFDFSLAKNGGSVSIFNVDYEYKPYSPYIHISIDFANLYGSDFDDARGLICGGDFSLPLVSDAWQTYQIQNKNYKAIFDREIQHLDTKNDIALRAGIFNTAVASVGAGIAGAKKGMAAGPIGAVAGAVIGASSAALTGGVNVALGQESYREERDFAIDKFNYQLGNVQALPQSLAKVSSFNPNNKYFPFLEFYTCTDVEKQALRDKIRCDGMTIMTIGKIPQFKGDGETYIKGQIIRCPDLADDAHMLSECYNELNRGLFFE